jgi:hypothetical protein
MKWAAGNPEDGSNLFFQNSSRLSAGYMVLYPRRQEFFRNFLDFWYKWEISLPYMTEKVSLVLT